MTQEKLRYQYKNYFYSSLIKQKSLENYSQAINYFKNIKTDKKQWYYEISQIYLLQEKFLREFKIFKDSI